MKSGLKILIFVSLTFLGYKVQSQSVDFVVEGIMEEYLEGASDDVDFSELEDQLYNFYYEPISLNADREDLEQLFFLSAEQINDILDYRRRYRDFVSIYELKTIQSLDKKTVERLLYFVKVEPNTSRYKLKPKDILRGRDRIILRNEQLVENQSGYEEPEDPEKSHYLGDKQKYYLRYDHRLGKSLSYGVTMEKDPGEEFFTGSNKNGFDFYSAHFYIGNQEKLKSLAIGDYFLRFGQGVVFSNSFAMSKGPNVLNLYRAGDYIRPYRSVNENIYMRGVATTVRLFESDITVFYSNKMIDGSGAEELEEEQDQFNSFYTAGYHRTASEIAKKRNLNEQVIGGHFEKSLEHLRFGLTAVHGFYDKTLALSDKVYKAFDFSGDKFTNLGVNYTYNKNNYLLFGETGYDLNGLASLNGALINLGSNIQAGLIYRYYDKEYVAPYANAFRSNTRVQNERGFYLALSFQPFKYWKVNTYIDHFSYPWLRYLVDQPSNGKDYMTEISYTPDYYTKTYLRIRYYQKEKNLPGNETTTNIITPYSRLSARWHISYQLSNRLEARTRIEYARYKIEETTDGVLLFQDLIFSPSNKKLRLIGRYALFNTDDYNSRIYTYENDVLYSFSIPAFYGKGARYYLVLKYIPIPNLDIYFKISRTNYFDRESISSGLAEIEGNNRTDMKVMLVFDF